MKLSVKLPWDILSTLTPSPAPSRTSLSSKTLVKDLEDMWNDKVLRSFLMLDLDETHSKASLGYFEYSNTITRSTKNIPVLQDSRKRLGGKVSLDKLPDVRSL